MTAGASTHDTIRWGSFETPFGRMYCAVSRRGVCRLTWHVSGPEEFEEDLRARFPAHQIAHDEASAVEIRPQIEDYLAGRRYAFDLRVDTASLSAFERDVLEAARRIPFGSTISYGQLADSIGRPRAARAVGNALRYNPIPIVIPCHRIVRADGSPGGYGGPHGTHEKTRLLNLEARTPNPDAGRGRHPLRAATPTSG